MLNSTENVERKVFKPGSYKDIPEEVYHASAGISKSMLAKMDCPLKVNAQSKPSDAKFTGNVVHAAILEPKRFDKDFVGAPQLDLRTKAGKEAMAELQEKNKGKIIVKPDLHAKACYMRDAVWAHPTAAKLLGAGGVTEQSHYWIDERTGELCKCRTDFMSKKKIIVDLKTTSNASPGVFARRINDFKYHWQDVWYTEGTKAKDFIFLVVEDDEIVLGSKTTYAVELYDLTDRARMQAKVQLNAALDRYLVCRDLDDWPTYNDSDRINKIDLPRWAQQEVYLDE